MSRLVDLAISVERYSPPAKAEVDRVRVNLTRPFFRSLIPLGDEVVRTGVRLGVVLHTPRRRLRTHLYIHEKRLTKDSRGKLCPS